MFTFRDDLFELPSPSPFFKDLVRGERYYRIDGVDVTREAWIEALFDNNPHLRMPVLKHPYTVIDFRSTT